MVSLIGIVASLRTYWTYCWALKPFLPVGTGDSNEAKEEPTIFLCQQDMDRLVYNTDWHQTRCERSWSLWPNPRGSGTEEVQSKHQPK